jgi:hypothetical protein
VAELCLPRSSLVGPPLGTWTFLRTGARCPNGKVQNLSPCYLETLIKPTPEKFFDQARCVAKSNAVSNATLKWRRSVSGLTSV